MKKDLCAGFREAYREALAREKNACTLPCCTCRSFGYEEQAVNSSMLIEHVTVCRSEVQCEEGNYLGLTKFVPLSSLEPLNCKKYVPMRSIMALAVMRALLKL